MVAIKVAYWILIPAFLFYFLAVCFGHWLFWNKLLEFSLSHYICSRVLYLELFTESIYFPNLQWAYFYQLFFVFFSLVFLVPLVFPLFTYLYSQMVESSAHGDDYDGVIFSQLVCLFFFVLINFYLSIIHLKFLSSFCFQNLIDLAGSESSKTETTGMRRKEGSYINKSLLTLGTVSVLRVNEGQ